MKELIFETEKQFLEWLQQNYPHIGQEHLNSFIESKNIVIKELLQVEEVERDKNILLAENLRDNLDVVNYCEQAGIKGCTLYNATVYKAQLSLETIEDRENSNYIKKNKKDRIKINMCTGVPVKDNKPFYNPRTGSQIFGGIDQWMKINRIFEEF